MLTKSARFEMKLAGETGQIEGYGSVFGHVDDGGDMIVQGAFARSIAARRPKMLHSHNMSAVIGVWDELVEDAKGLRCVGRLNLETQRGAEVHSMLKMDPTAYGLSIGYRTLKAVTGEHGGRRIEEAEVWEISPVAFPMNELATIDAVKALDQGKTTPIKRIVEQAAREAGLSAQEAKAAAAGAAERLVALREEGSELSELAAYMRRAQQEQTEQEA